MNQKKKLSPSINSLFDDTWPKPSASEKKRTMRAIKMAAKAKIFDFNESKY